MTTADPSWRGDPGDRVIFVSPSGVVGGQENIVLGLSRQLISRGVAVEAVLLQPGPLAERLASIGVEVTLLQAGRLREPHRGLLAIARLWRHLRRRSPEIMVCATMAKGHLYAGLAARLAGRREVWLQADIPRRSDWLQRVAATVPTCGVFTESRDALEAQRLILKRSGLAHLVHPGIDVDRYAFQRYADLREARQIGAEAPLISIVGRLQEWKGQREFLMAAAIVLQQFPGTRFAVVGGAILGSEGDYPQRLRELVEQLGIADQVNFTGHVDTPDRWIQASDIVVSASNGEPFGLVVLEALASGCAVVAVRRGGPRDVIVHGETGLLCESNEPGQIAEALLRMLREPELRLRLAEAGRLSIAGQFTESAMADRFVEAVAGVLA